MEGTNVDRGTRPEDKKPLACTAALQVTEILEVILLYLPLRRIVGSKSWRDNFEGSINIQRALFLVPLSGCVARYRPQDEMARRTVMKVVGSVEKTVAKLVPEIVPSAGRWVHPTFKKNEKPTFFMKPLLKPLLRNVRTSSKDNMGMELNSNYCSLKDKDLDTILVPNWKAALLVQPARSSCSVICSRLRQGELAETSWVHPASYFGLFGSRMRPASL